MSVIFYHDEEQKQLAEETRAHREALLGRTIYTEIVPASRFYQAESYHQKYYLRHEGQLLREYEAIYPGEADFLASTAVARVNGYVGGYGTPAALEEELAALGLSPAAGERLQYIVSSHK